MRPKTDPRTSARTVQPADALLDRVGALLVLADRGHLDAPPDVLHCLFVLAAPHLDLASRCKAEELAVWYAAESEAEDGKADAVELGRCALTHGN